MTALAYCDNCKTIYKFVITSADVPACPKCGEEVK